MNLNRFKKGFSSTNPERGLRDLPGAIKNERHPDSAGTVRVRGRYIPRNTDRAGLFFGMMSYIHAWLYVLILPCSIFSIGEPIFSPLAVAIIGMFVVHGCAIIADSLRHVSEAPWARKGIKIFWLATLAWSVIAMIYFSI